MNKNHFSKDLHYGLNSEDVLLHTLNKYFKCNFKKTSTFESVDFIDKDRKIVVELKTRRNTRYQYPTTMIGSNKVEEAEKHINNPEGPYRVYFVFKFTDDLCIFKVCEDSICESWEKMGGRSDRGVYEHKLYYYIPVNLLKSIS